MTDKKRNFRILSMLPSAATMAAESPAPGTRKYGELVAGIMASCCRSVSSREDGLYVAGSVSVHAVTGMVTWQSWWRFSTAAFIDELARAEADDRITAHLIVIDSPGGEIFGCHEAWQAIRSCSKPTYALCREYAASAAYWLASACTKVYAESPLSSIGCIGTMAVLMDDIGAYEKAGIKVVELYAHGSGDKNKASRDALDGKPEDYITGRLDPVQKVMLDDIKAGRGLKDDNEALTGRIYYAEGAQAVSLTDGIASIGEVLSMLEPSAPPKTDINSLNLF